MSARAGLDPFRAAGHGQVQVRRRALTWTALPAPPLGRGPAPCPAPWHGLVQLFASRLPGLPDTRRGCGPRAGARWAQVASTSPAPPSPARRPARGGLPAVVAG